MMFRNSVAFFLSSFGVLSLVTQCWASSVNSTKASPQVEIVSFQNGKVSLKGELYDQFFGEKTVIVYSRSNYASYGFATDFSIERAMKKAQIEQVRNSGILSEYTNKKSDICSLQESRLLFFSTKAGFELFEKKIDATKVHPNGHAVAPELIIDSEICGPWSKYATVWRCLFDHFNFEQNNNSSNIDLFYF